ncbi:hypothetical protein GIB67_007411 [Kingdonia uniflora]|uniref:Uncharacterized protein n=1 Tax=Kingdonia uniflora TaxID=39325 RepID=A0A7J7MLS7_9MAGN|nr:hypothetical protein GIB67_007411 [Kingdonia uniflora]
MIVFPITPLLPRDHKISAVRSRVLSGTQRSGFYDENNYLIDDVDYMTYWHLAHPNPSIGCTLLKRVENIWMVGRDLVRPDVRVSPTSSLATSSQVENYSVDATDEDHDEGWFMDIAGTSRER